MKNNRKVVNIIAEVLKYVILVAGSVFTILPFIWMISSSLKTPAELVQVPPALFPEVPQWLNYKSAWEAAPFARYLVNTIIVTICTTAGVLVTTVLSAFAFSRLNFPGKKTVFSLFLATLMIPGEMLIITNYETIIKLKWIDSYRAMIVPWISSAFYIYLLTRFFMQVPESLYLAAKVDKCSDFKYMIKIMVPMNKQAIFSIAILNIISSWNAFLWPLLVTNSQEMRVLSNGLVRFQTEAGSSTELIMAASCILVMPIIIIYLFLRKYIIEGVTRSGLKG
ncbi:multiple sugar transport system permease protein [Butyrivibrio sp. Su6]|uniref:Multiple sugar transport system permease protein n=1 Tax=Butyrivibrio proteoclasticus TaxID=43305 RepID=A0A1I5R1E0_9FIRM|nr:MULTISPECIES: carbohydrate ABC transporter permease [Butyrivibrio]MBQ9305459.1 carbohydrate ABC transporter permease [Butyrivibrio sp.]SEF96538.1 multiple sugar transport system permease protein [Butyrivibrio sp. Su6]SFP52305.1 multiple sugar transport system permease protein [Butyrivibrio proteoclasticus]